MKISQKQLRKLISEAIQGREVGQPEPFALDEEGPHALNTGDAGGDPRRAEIDEAVQVLAELIVQFVSDDYSDEADVDAMLTEVVNELQNVVNQFAYEVQG